MKTISILGMLSVCSLLQGQTLNQATAITDPSNVPAPTPYAIVAQGANHQVWQWETYELIPGGRVMPHVHQYTELATGLNHLVNGQWVASKEEIDISPDGSSASATKGNHQAYFPGDIYNGVIKLVTPDGKSMSSQPVGLSYFDGTNTVLLAVLTNSTGQVLSSGNQVIYTNAFSGLNADLLYTYTKAGFEQDVILREQPPDPGSLNLNGQSTRIQVLTEFFNVPQPTVTSTTVTTAAGNLEDDYLSFGAMQMGRGKAFILGADSPAVGVNKQWLVLQGRQFLVEEVPIVSIASDIDTLPPFVSQAGSGTRPVVSKNLMLPPQRLTHASPKATFVAKAMRPGRGFVLDYVTMTSQTNYTFQGDSTYYISGTVNLSGTNNILEGGAVLKFTTNSTAGINIGSGALLNCLTAPYRPAILTATDDNTVGESISGSSGNPTGYYANPALGFANAATQTVSNVRIAYARQALSKTSSTYLNVYDAQLVNCQNGFSCNPGSIANFRNVLFSNVRTNFNNIDNMGIYVQNGTFSGSTYLITTPDGHLALTLTSCILANITNLTSYPIISSGLPVGSYNGFYNCTNFGSSTFTNTSYPFQTVGAGNYYLASGCAFINVGTTNNLDPVLLADLQKKTTYPPIAYSNATITTNLTLSPQARRDTNAAPDLGYHYDPLDYAFGGCAANSNITFTAGTAVGWFRTTSGYGGYEGQGIYVHTNGIAAFQGTEAQPAYWVRCNTVQEGGANAPWQGGYGPGGITGGDDDQNNYQILGSAEVHLTFTRCSSLAADQGCFFRDDWGYMIVRASHSEFYSGNIGGYDISCYFTNCFMHRMSGGQDAGWPGNQYIVRNCTWIGGPLNFTPYQTRMPISVRDCVFEGTTFGISGYGTGTNADYDYNAYTNGAPELPAGGSHNITNIVSFNWQSSWLGNYYLPPGSPLLNQGDVPASQLGLYHFTIQTNQVPEGTNTVSIGYHYVALDANGNPLDSNGDGIPDYLEDANGDGIYDAGDLGDWQGLNLNVIITQPRNGSILP
jgi:hypothetical protein